MEPTTIWLILIEAILVLLRLILIESTAIPSNLIGPTSIMILIESTSVMILIESAMVLLEPALVLGGSHWR